MITINTTKPSFLIGELLITRVEIEKIGFVAFCEIGDEASEGATDQKKISNAMFRGRIKRQVTAYDSSNSPVKLSDLDILNIPLKHALAIKDAFNKSDANDSKAVCKMLHKGDGMLTPIHISLGSPIKSGSDGKTIKELEFTAGTLGDLEDFVSADGSLDRAVAMINIATPVGEGLTITRLPSWAITQISLEDGIWIMNNVVPSFLLQPETSTETP